MPSLKLGAQLYTVREYTQNEKDFAETIKKIAEIGYKYVQVSGIGKDISAQFVKKVTEDCGVKVILTHTSAERIKNDPEKVIEEHNIFNCPAIGVGGISGVERNADGFKKFADDFAHSVEKIKTAGKVFLYHNHRFEFEKFSGDKTGIDILLENSDKDGFKLTFDTYWAHAGGVDPAQFIKNYKDRIFATHLKDMAVVGDKSIMTELLTGNMNFARILKVSEKSELFWHFVEQDEMRIIEKNEAGEVRFNAFESMKISYDNLIATGKFEK
jgi:sugar phosphate isomerase/epimerase